MLDRTLVRKWRNKATNKEYLFLAVGLLHETSSHLDDVVIYCPDDNEHSVFVMRSDLFYHEFEPIAEEGG